MKTSLPIDSILTSCAEEIDRGASLILQASPGSGKTTRLPPYLLKEIKFPPDSQIWVLEPRRLAAKFAATRVAEENQWQLGETVGYHFRFEKKYSKETRLLYLTEGMLMRRLVGNPTLKGVSTVIIDEFHERHLHTDLALSFLRHLQKTARPDLKLIVMSATLELDALTQFLPDAPVIKIESPLFPVEMFFLNQDQLEKPLSRLVKDCVQKEFLKNHTGDCLVFLPGLREIRQCEAELETLARQHRFNIFGLHGDFSKEEQERALSPSSKRKVVLSTNLAETSLTIPGVNLVIDSGLKRTASYSWWTGIPLLSTQKTSKASAIQRAGRAGRTEPGVCYRLYTQHDFETRTPFDTPEIKRADLAQTILELKALGVGNLAQYNWFEPPSKNSIDSALQLLFRIGALDAPCETGTLTQIGKEMKDMSLHPRISRFLIACRDNGCLDKGYILAALISEGKLNSLEVIEQLHSRLDPLTERLKEQIKNTFNSAEVTSPNMFSSVEDCLSFSLLSAFSDRVAEHKNSQFVLSAGGTANLKPGSDFHSVKTEPYVIALDLQETKRGSQSTTFLNSLVRIQQNWLYELTPSPLEEAKEVFWDKEREKVSSRSVIKLGQLVLENLERPVSDEDLNFKVLVREILRRDSDELKNLSLLDWIETLKNLFTQNEMEHEIARAQVFNSYLCLGLEVNSETLEHFLKSWFNGKRSRKEIASPDCIFFFRDFFSKGAHHQLEKKCPSQIVFPNQRKATVHYEIGKPPWVESKLQDFFGLTQPPQICDGRIALTVHLLAPNFRAVQVTSDLKGFWENHYSAIRKELSRNYPKHPWPENPYIPLPPKPPKKN